MSVGGTSFGRQGLPFGGPFPFQSGRLGSARIRENDSQPTFWRRLLAVALPEAPTRGYWLALIGTAALLRAIVALGVLGQMPIFSDADAYSRQAIGLIHGHTHHPYYWPPGTSYVLAAGYWAFGIHTWVARVLMIAVSVLSVVTTTLIARRLLRDVRAALLAGWVLALYPGMIMQSAEPFAFDVTLLAVNLTALFALRAWEGGRLLDYAATGLALGFAALARPATLLLLLPLAAFAALIIRRRQVAGEPTGLGRVVAGAAVLVVSTSAAIAPAVAHNEVNHEGATVSVNNELNVWLGNNPYTPNYRTDYLGQHPLSDFPPNERSYLRRYMYGTDPTRAQRSADLDEAERFAADHPAVTALRTANRVRGFWGFDYTISNLFRTNWGKGYKAEAVGLVFEAGGYFVLALLVIVALIFARDNLRSGALSFLIALIAAFQLPHALVYGAGRWHYPVLGLLAIFAGAGAAWLINTPDRWRRVRTSAVFWTATIVFFAIQAEYAYFRLT
jgi:4-amino-4-deoxy-L-arabinose transferase-like glycosyltransferase